MRAPRTGRARRIDPAVEIDPEDGRRPDYATSFAADLAEADTQSPEQWARSILEGAPRALRWFVVIGWKLVLRLRLAPRGADGAIAGWTIGRTTPDRVTLEVSSSLVTARKVLEADADRLTLTTYVWYENKRGRLLWSASAPVHHRIEPLLLTLAVSADHRRQGRASA
jgi:hypothetical protein